MTWVEDRIACCAQGVYEQMFNLLLEYTEAINNRQDREQFEAVLRDLLLRPELPEGPRFECLNNIEGRQLHIRLVSQLELLADVFAASIDQNSIIAHSGYADAQRAETGMRITPRWNRADGKCMLNIEYPRSEQPNRTMACAQLPLLIQELLEPAFFPERV